MANGRKSSLGRIEQPLPFVVSTLTHLVIFAILYFSVIPVVSVAGILLWGGAAEIKSSEFALSSDNRLDSPLPDVENSLDVFAMSPIETLFDEVGLGPTKKEVIFGESKSLQRAASLEGAVDGITEAIRGALMSGDLAVVWLFDASNSLVDDRQRIAERLNTFLADSMAGSSGAAVKGRLLNTVFSFGAKPTQILKPTASRELVVTAIKEMPVDASGRENVFAAIGHCVQRFSSPSRTGALMLVVWTDESGDDGDKLESTIKICQSENVAVHVVGPTAVLGSDTGFHAYRDSRSELEYLLPVTRGPDSAVDERIRLGYWYRTRSPERRRGRGSRSQLPMWYGGQDLAGISSGFSPFTLTRLARETHGTFTILDSDELRPPFELEDLKAYLPRYRTVADYLAEVESSPLRAAVLGAVSATRASQEIPSRVRQLLRFGAKRFDKFHRFSSNV